MTREERRKAVEVLLGIEPAQVQYICCAVKGRSDAVEAGADEKDVAASGPASPAHSLESSQEGPVCSICLDGYETTDLEDHDLEQELLELRKSRQARSDDDHDEDDAL